MSTSTQIEYQEILLKGKSLLSPISRMIIAIYLLSSSRSVKIKDMLYLVDNINYLAKTTMYSTLDKLEKKGLLRIVRNEKNRITSLELTEKGKDIAINLVSALEKIQI